MSIITCPNCKFTLLRDSNTLKCQNNHSFDYAKEGYVNLLLANQKKKLNPGDSKLMITAREAFLCKGYFDFLLDKIEKILSTSYFSKNSEKLHLLDLGCGSGYYTRNILKTDNINKIGVDISKIGVAKASKMDKKSTYLVGSVFDLPIKLNSTDIVINIFSPVDLDALNKILKPGGIYIKVIPIGNHMKEVAELIYETFIPHQSSIKQEIQSNSFLSIIQIEQLNKTISIAGKDLLNFISMTPYFYKFKEDDLYKIKELSITVEFEIIVASRL